MNFAYVSGYISSLSPVYLRVCIFSLPSVSVNHPISFQSVSSTRKNPEFIYLVCNCEPRVLNPSVPGFPSNPDLHSSGMETVVYPLP